MHKVEHSIKAIRLLKEHGFLDLIVNRKELKEKLAQIFRIIKK